ISSVPTGNGVPTRSERRSASRVASGTPRVRIPTKARPARSFWRSAISCAIRSIIRPMRSASRIFAFLRRRASVKSARVYGQRAHASRHARRARPRATIDRSGEELPMVFYNASTRELTAKIVYYGPGLCGKTTNLQVLHGHLDPGTAGELLALSTETDRTIYFDLLPVELGDIKGYTIRFQLATVPGQTAFNETRRIVLKGADGIVFVADSQWTMLPKNLESWQSLKENLVQNGAATEPAPEIPAPDSAPAAEQVPAPAAESETLEPPFAEAVEGISPAAVAELEERIRTLEKRFLDQAGALEVAAETAMKAGEQVGEA